MPSSMQAQGNLGYKVSYSTLSWQELVVREWGTEWGRPDTAYEWSNGRSFDCTDGWKGGVYNVAYGFRLLLDPVSRNSDMYQYGLLQENSAAVDLG